MKFISYILSFYMLALCCFPCADNNECNDEQTTIISATQDAEHQHSTEACTPFCSCACCSTVSISQQFSFLKTIPLVFQELKFLPGNDDFHSYDFHAVWQPPKIS